MKKSEAYVNLLAKEFGIPVETAEAIYKAINKFDWKVFCSYMADDRDHPEERKAAREELISVREKYDTELFDKIQAYMSDDNNYSIHHMEEEVDE
jgi:hypothetical protein